MSRAPCSPSTEPPAPKGRKPRLQTSTRPNAKGALPASTAGGAPVFCLYGKLRPGISAQNGAWFPQTPPAETASRFERRFWDTVSATGLSQKLHPTLDVHYGTQFPEGRLSHAILIKTRPHSAPKITSSHARASTSGGATARRHTICCTVKSASGTLILYLANKFKEGRMSCQDGKHRSRSCSPCSRLHLP